MFLNLVVNQQVHVTCIRDMMCSKGKIMAANRHGINSSDIGPLAKSSFEETTDQFKTAGVFGLIDNIDGVSSNIMVGQIPNCGTGNTEIILDEELIKNTKPRELVEDVRKNHKIVLTIYLIKMNY